MNTVCICCLVKFAIIALVVEERNVFFFNQIAYTARERIVYTIWPIWVNMHIFNYHYNILVMSEDMTNSRQTNTRLTMFK